MSDLKPGRELDALVAEKVMGWKLWPMDIDPDTRRTFDPLGNPPGGSIEVENMKRVPHYSTDIAAAWGVVTFSNAPFQLFSNPVRKTWTADFGSPFGGGAPVTAPTAPHAICLAALKAVVVREL